MHKPLEIRSILFTMVIAFFMLGCDSGNMLEATEDVSNLSDAPFGSQESLNQAKLDEIAALQRASHIEYVASIHDLDKLNRRLANISKSIARVLSNKETARWFHGQVMNQFDGDTDVLWMHLENEVPLNRHDDWNTLVREENNRRGENSDNFMSDRRSLTRAIKRIEEVMGAPLHLYWAFAEEWDGEQAPLVTYRPLHLRSDDITELVAYNHRGQEITVNEEIASSRPVVVITNNERTNLDGTLNHEINPAPYVPCGDCGGGGGGNNNGSVIGGKYKFGLIGAQFNGHYESWLSGRPEFKVQFHHLTGSTATLFHTFFVNPRPTRSEASSGNYKYWTIPEMEMFIWDSDVYKTYTAQWYEEDNTGTTVTIPLSSTFKKDDGGQVSAGFSVAIKGDDTMLGFATTHLTDLNVEVPYLDVYWVRKTTGAPNYLTYLYPQNAGFIPQFTDYYYN